ncbi:BZ3500_MvSof-1268-A1-R1_Chr3-1g05501 [Microbotryum saponariae]|uniref:BZ3500_MvSof-1268-A1-R1_Chr3-1g05501 protein n=1 Tax=Microbotryum saponariae TaxID=289078 RepID=A0A2X0N0D0_9BASI|nr:BZ3500_MvSof-1268-A1-R1_Chr3-1g05501 [Microbotryum saponariae]SDA04692.1 BZ3501_MvSof-1269-A2-R1_Chr3-1g05172 [Microbotryum saponariae]
MTTTKSALPVKAPPWDLTGSGYIFVIEPQPFSPTEAVPLPSGSYDPFEQGTSFDQSSNFHGGVGAILVVRYTTSDVVTGLGLLFVKRGPYDELMIIPGNFKNKLKDGTTSFDLAITRIYVSTKESVYNGRQNWGIPKHQSDFSFTPVQDRPGSTLLTVSSPGAEDSFFSAILTRSRWTPFAIPVSTKLASTSFMRSILRGYRPTLVQPALSTQIDPSKLKSVTSEDASTLVGSSAKFAVTPTSTGWSKACTISPVSGARKGYGNGVGFPEFKPWWGGLGVELTEFNMVFPVPEVVE